MIEECKARMARFQTRLAEEGVEAAIVTDEGSIAYLAGFWGYLGLEFGRPTLLVIRPDADPIAITPLMELEMVAAMTWLEDVRGWEDSGPNGWATQLDATLAPAPAEIGVEAALLPAPIRAWLDDRGLARRDVAPILGGLRMVKSAAEIGVMRQAGKVAGAMMAAAEAALAEGAPEYEAALAVMAAGTRAAAGFLTDKGWEAFVSPIVHGLQIMPSGDHMSMVHRRASVRPLERGDPVYFCFCTLAEFKHYRLGFDRVFYIKEIDAEARRVQEAAIAAQAAAVAAIRPGVSAESVAEAANAVYAERGFEPGYRTGRAIGLSYLEAPELKPGDATVLQPGMTFAVDGGISSDGGHGGRIGDSVVVTETGCDFLTEYPREILVVDR